MADDQRGNAVEAVDLGDDTEHGEEGERVALDQELTTNTMDDSARSDGGRRRGN
jgi:hypothetical protein